MLFLSGAFLVSLSSRLPFWRSGNVPWTMPIKLGRWSLEVPGTPEIGELVELLALIFENSRTSTSIYISKLLNINFSKLQSVNGGCLGV